MLRTILLGLAGLIGTAHAATVAVTFDPASQSGAPGDTLTYTITVENLTAQTVYLNSVDVNLTGFDPSDIDNSPFFSGPASLNANETSAPFAVFTVTIPNPFTADTYMGSLQLVGGADSNDQTLLLDTPATFSVVVNTPASGVPEPSTLALMGAGLAACATVRRFRHR